MSKIMIMLKITFLIISIVVVLSKAGYSEVLNPPERIPFAKDIIIKKYSTGNPLKLFVISGKWEELREPNKNIILVGTSDENEAILVSIDKLSKKPKSFKLDFTIQNKNGEFGFIFGEIGIIVKGGKICPAVFSNKRKLLTKSASECTKISQGISSSNTLAIDTGYDPINGGKLICTIYINGSGISFNNPDVDSPFGVYISKKNSISISNIRWGIGSK